MKIIILPLLKYTFSFIINVYILLMTLCFYPIVVIWEFKIMKWGEYMEYNYSNSVNLPDSRICEMLSKESIFDTIKRWINFNYSLVYEFNN